MYENPPPPYTPADKTPFVLGCVAKYIDHREYPKLCLVSTTWRDIFQAFLWSQPDRYFSTKNRAANTGFQKFIHSFYSVRPRLLATIVHFSLHNVSESVYISLPTDFIQTLLASARDLRSLDLSPGFLISHAHVVSVRSFHHSLTTLSLAGCQAFSSATLAQFLSYFPNLHRLDLSGTSGVNPNLFTILPTTSQLTAIRLRHQPFKISDSTVKTLAQTLESNLTELDLSFSLKGITGASIDAIEKYSLARPPTYTSEFESVSIGPGPRRLGVAYTSIPLAAISRLLHSDMIHLVALDVAGLSHTPESRVDFWESLARGASFQSLQALRLDFLVFAANASFNISSLPPALYEFTLHNVPAVEVSPSPRVTRVLTMLLTDLMTMNSYHHRLRLRILNLEMAPKEDEQTVGMYDIEERDTGDEIDVIEEIKKWKRSQRRVWEGQIRVIRDVVGIRGYAQEFGSGLGDVLGPWVG